MLELLEEFSLYQWVSNARNWVIYFLRNWIYLLLAIISGTVIGYIYIKDTKPVYTASLTFVLATESKSAGISGLASQFGLEVGGMGNESIFAGDNILELFKSRKLITKMLLHEVKGKNINLLNLIGEEQNMFKKGFPKFPDDTAKFTPVQNKLFRKIVNSTTASINVSKKDKKLSFYIVDATSASEGVAYYMVENIVEVTSRYFIDTKLKVARQNLELLTKEADSLKNLLGTTIEATAYVSDRTYNMNPSIVIQRSGIQLNQARMAALSVAYSEVMRNLEIAKISVQKETPLFEVIDEPQTPLAIIVPDNRKSIIRDAGISVFFMLVLLVMSRWYRLSNKKMSK